MAMIMSYYQLNGHTVFDPVTDGYDLTNIDTVGGAAHTAPPALYTREARLAGITLTQDDEALIAGINLAHVGSCGGYARAVTALLTRELNGRKDCLPWYKVFLDSCATYHVLCLYPESSLACVRLDLSSKAAAMLVLLRAHVKECLVVAS